MSGADDATRRNWICVAGYIFDFTPRTFRATGATEGEAAHAALQECEANREDSYLASECRIRECREE
jgi:hypothetical protein